MSSSNVKNEFSEFGKKCLILAILSLISFILGILSFSVPELGYVNIVIFLIYVIIMIMALGNINEAANKLNNKDLFSFRKRMIVVLVLSLIGLILLYVGLAGILAIASSSDPGSSSAIAGYATFGLMMLVGIILLIVALIMEIIAWSDLRGFFRDNKSMFSEDIAKSAKTGSLLMMLGAIPIVGPILRVVGCFMLSKLKNL